MQMTTKVRVVERQQNIAIQEQETVRRERELDSKVDDNDGDDDDDEDDDDDDEHSSVYVNCISQILKVHILDIAEVGVLYIFSYPFFLTFSLDTGAKTSRG